MSRDQGLYLQHDTHFCSCSFCSCERTLEVWEIDLVHKKQLTVGKSKTDAGTGRVIPLNDTVMIALEAHAA